MYRELGGYVGYMLTPVRILQEIRLSILAEMTVQAEKEKEQEQEQEKLKQEAGRLRARAAR